MPEITTETIAWRKFFIADPAVYKNIDGQRVRLPEAGINLGDGGRASASSGGGLRLDFPDGAILLVTPGWWSAQQLWYLNISVLGSRAEAGIMGVRLSLIHI